MLKMIPEMTIRTLGEVPRITLTPPLRMVLLVFAPDNQSQILAHTTTLSSSSLVTQLIPRTPPHNSPSCTQSSNTRSHLHAKILETEGVVGLPSIVSRTVGATIWTVSS
jgi:hypothetical protein